MRVIAPLTHFTAPVAYRKKKLITEEREKNY
jgi:hypothetical protein